MIKLFVKLVILIFLYILFFFYLIFVKISGRVKTSVEWSTLKFQTVSCDSSEESSFQKNEFHVNIFSSEDYYRVRQKSNLIAIIVEICQNYGKLQNLCHMNLISIYSG